jgi:hypothetical protein
MRIKKQFQGMSPHRYKSDPLEKKFAEKWQEQNDRGTATLEFLMDETNRGRPEPPVSNRDRLVSNTVVQWLGSPVGQCFLVEVLSSPQGRAFREYLASEMKEKKR